MAVRTVGRCAEVALAAAYSPTCPADPILAGTSSAAVVCSVDVNVLGAGLEEDEPAIHLCAGVDNITSA